MSMIFHPVLEETVILANKNMILKNRGGEKYLQFSLHTENR